MRTIPYITHQIWLQGWDKLPDKYKQNVIDLHDMNINYTHMQWDEKTLQKECAKISNDVLVKFNSFKNLTEKVDLGRYVVLYNYGGISIDTDMKSLKSLDSTPNLDTADFIISNGPFPLNSIGIVNNAVFFVKPKHEIMINIIQNVLYFNNNETSYILKEMYIFAGGPGLVNTVIQKNKDKVIVLDNKYFEPCTTFIPGCSIGKDAIVDHQHSATWINPYNQVFIKTIIFLLFIFFGIFIINILLYIFNISIKNLRIKLFTILDRWLKQIVKPIY